MQLESDQPSKSPSPFLILKGTLEKTTQFAAVCSKREHDGTIFLAFFPPHQHRTPS
jgi:hypothetical protein